MANELPDYSYYEAVLRYHELTWELLQQKYPELRGNGQNYIKDEKGRFAGSRPGSGSKKGLDNSPKSGIIKSGSEGMYRKSKEGKIEPMPKKQLRRIVKSFEAHGGRIQMSEETDRYLESKHSEGITYDSKTVLLRQNPGRASVFEELIHTAQYRDGKNDGSYVSRVKCEIEAQKILLKNAKAYKLTEPEIFQTKEALKGYEQELEIYYRKQG